jgi:hypothetical protein
MTVFVPQGYGHAIFSMSLTGDNEALAVTLGVRDQDPVVNTPNEIAAGLFDAFGDEILPELTNVITLTQCEVFLQRDGDSWDDVPPDTGVATGAVAGSETGQSAVQNTAYLVHKRSAEGGRRGRGRWYLPGVAEGDVSPAGAVTSGRQTTMNAALVDFLARFGAAGLTDMAPVILHGLIGSSTPPPGFGDPTLITAMTLDPVAATQRRRLRR